MNDAEFKRAFAMGEKAALVRLVQFIADSTALDTWAKDAVRRVIEQFMGGSMDCKRQNNVAWLRERAKAIRFGKRPKTAADWIAFSQGLDLIADALDQLERVFYDTHITR